MAGGFEKAFQAFIRKSQLDNDENNNTDDDDDLYDKSSQYDSDADQNEHFGVELNKVTESKSEKHKPIPKLKLMVDPDYVSKSDLSPFSLRRYIKSPNSFSSSVPPSSSSTPNGAHSSPVLEAEIRNRLGADAEVKTGSQTAKKALFPRRGHLKSVKKTSRLKCTYQKRIVLKKYGLQYPVRKHPCKDKTNVVTIKESSGKSFSKDIHFDPLNKDSVNTSVVTNKPECDSHYFCAQGEGLSRNSPEAAKSVISSPANASVGESSFTDASVSPIYDSVTTVGIVASDNHYIGDVESQPSVTSTNRTSPIQNSVKLRDKSSILLQCGQCMIKCNCDTVQTIGDASKKVTIKKSRRHTVSAEKDITFTDIVSNHLSNEFGHKMTSNRNSSKKGIKRKRNYSENLKHSDPDYVLEDTEDEYVSTVECKKLSRPKRSRSCLCCSNKDPKHVRRQSLKCNISDFKYLSIQDQNFINHSVQLSNIKSKLHSLFCSVFPRLVPILHNITPESRQFYLLIEDMLHVLQSSDEEELLDDTGNVVNLLEDMHLKNESDVIPVFDPSVRLCQNPKQCLESFRDKVVCLLQLLLPSLIISLDSFLSSTRELEKFLDKVISSNCV